MNNDRNELTQLNLSLKEKANIPLGVNVIFMKPISSLSTENRVSVYSEKYKKLDLFSFVSEKPLSKLF